MILAEWVHWGYRILSQKSEVQDTVSLTKLELVRWLISKTAFVTKNKPGTLKHVTLTNFDQFAPRSGLFERLHRPSQSWAMVRVKISVMLLLLSQI